MRGVCVCDEHKDSFSNLFLTTEKYTKVLFPACSDRSTEKKTESDGDRALCKRNAAPHWVWPPSPWKLKVGSSCRHMTHTLLYTHHFRASGWGCLGNRLMENLRGTYELLLGCLFCRSRPRQRWSVPHPGDCGAAEGCRQREKNIDDTSEASLLAKSWTPDFIWTSPLAGKFSCVSKQDLDHGNGKYFNNFTEHLKHISGQTLDNHHKSAHRGC